MEFLMFGFIVGLIPMLLELLFAVRLNNIWAIFLPILVVFVPWLLSILSIYVTGPTFNFAMGFFPDAVIVLIITSCVLVFQFIGLFLGRGIRKLLRTET